MVSSLPPTFSRALLDTASLAPSSEPSASHGAKPIAGEEGLLLPVRSPNTAPCCSWCWFKPNFLQCHGWQPQLQHSLMAKCLLIPFLQAQEEHQHFLGTFALFLQGIRMLLSLQVIHKTDNFSLLSRRSMRYSSSSTQGHQRYNFMPLSALTCSNTSSFAILCVTMVSNDTLRHWVLTVPTATSKSSCCVQLRTSCYVQTDWMAWEKESSSPCSKAACGRTKGSQTHSIGCWHPCTPALPPRCHA